MGKKIVVPCFDVIMIVFFYSSIRNMVFHCIFLGKIYSKSFTLRPEFQSKYFGIGRSPFELELFFSSQ